MCYSEYYKKKMNEYREWELEVLNSWGDKYKLSSDYGIIILKRAVIDLLEGLKVFKFLSIFYEK